MVTSSETGTDVESTLEERILAGLDPEQREVATTLRGPVCVLAGAGTGKTRAITHRIAYGIATGVYTPQKVLALTFTARAANEMRNRLRELGAAGVQTRTFHAAALRQLQYFWPQAVGGPLPGLVEHKARLITEAAQNMRLSTDRAAVRDLAAEIEWAKVSMLTPDTYPTRAAGREMPLNYDVRTVQRLYQSYEELKTDRHLIDFEDVLLLTVAVLEEDERVAATVREQYRHFVVDEYQDVSPLQQFLLDQWLGGRDELCVVGDPSQTIYSFTGATPHHLLTFPTVHPAAQVVRLVRDYRSTPQVVGLANRVIRAKNILFSMAVYQFCRRRPAAARAFFTSRAARILGSEELVAEHFTPSYDPWDQRLCAVPDADLFKALKRGRAEVVTGTIDTFVPEGVRLSGGRVLEADLVVTATGLRLLPFGGIVLTVDGTPVELAEQFVWNGAMLTGVPNFALCIGYTNASWTLRADLTHRLVCRVLRHLERHDAGAVVPRAPRGMAEQPLLDLSSGYVRRAIGAFPRQGDRYPWRVRQNYLLDSATTMRTPLSRTLDLIPRTAARRGARPQETHA